MPRFPAHQFNGPDFRPLQPGGSGQFMHRPRGFPGPHHFSNFHPEGARFHGPHGRGMPPDQFFQRGPRPPYRGGIGGRPDRFPVHGYGPPQSQFGGGVDLGDEMFNRPSNEPKNYNNFHAENRASHSNFNRKPGHAGHGHGGKFVGLGQQQKDWKKKNKKAKEPKEINYSHYCDVCDRGFQSDEQLKSHVAEHVKCKEKDCRFVAHPKVVKMHHKLHHGPGSKKIRWLDTPEEIQKWRNERKRNYPTAENIAKKSQTMEQREKQGNVLETKQFGKMKRTHGGTKGGRRVRLKKMMAQLKEQGAGNQVAEETVNSDQVPLKKRKTDDNQGQSSPAADIQGAIASDPMQPTQGAETDHSTPMPLSSDGSTKADHRGPGRDADYDPLSLLASLENDSGDEETSCTQGVNSTVEVAPKGTFGALGSLAACYNSDSEESYVGETDDAAKTTRSNGVGNNSCHNVPEQCPAEENTSLKNPPASIQAAPTENGDEDRCHSSGISAARNDGDAVPERNKRFNRKEWKKQKAAANTRRKGAANQAEQKKATLLEMLLAPEIRKERNIILQCVRHIVKNNFFQDSCH